MISILDKSRKNSLPISTLKIKVSTLAIKQIDVTIISADTYCTTCRLKKAQVFAISIRNLKYQVEREARPKTNPRTVISAEYYDFLDIFSKKNLDTLPPY